MELYLTLVLFVLEIEVLNLMRLLRLIVIGINEDNGTCFWLALSKL